MAIKSGLEKLHDAERQALAEASRIRTAIEVFEEINGEAIHRSAVKKMQGAAKMAGIPMAEPEPRKRVIGIARAKGGLRGWIRKHAHLKESSITEIPRLVGMLTEEGIPHTMAGLKAGFFWARGQQKKRGKKVAAK